MKEKVVEVFATICELNLDNAGASSSAIARKSKRWQNAIYIDISILEANGYIRKANLEKDEQTGFIVTEKGKETEIYKSLKKLKEQQLEEKERLIATYSFSKDKIVEAAK